MIIKLLNIDLQYNSENDDCEIIVNYGKIFDGNNFKDMEKQIKQIKEKVVEVIKEELE